MGLLTRHDHCVLAVYTKQSLFKITDFPPINNLKPMNLVSKFSVLSKLLKSDKLLVELDM